MRSAAAELDAIRLDGVRFHNLIPSRFPLVDLYARIDRGRGLPFATVEELTNPRVREKARLSSGLAAVDQDDPRLRSWNLAPFSYPNPEGSTYLGPDRNVVELADALQTALAVSVARRERFLGRTREPETSIEIRQLVRPVTGMFVDARGWEGAGDPERRRALGAAVAQDGGQGVLFNPPERPTATAVAVIDPTCLGRPDQGQHFKFLWDGARIAVLYAFNQADGRAVLPDSLRREEDVLAA